MIDPATVVPGSAPARLDSIRAALERVIQGKTEAIELLLVGVLAGGHVLVEDVPGVGKTTLAKSLARAFVMTFSRVQFTPDLLPADIIGAQVLDPREGSFAFHRGPVFTNVLLADEINRASPRTQSALLEAMSEAQVTVDGATLELPRPFFVLATQNPHELAGTYPLPEAQLDRFLLRFGLGYPTLETELEVLFSRQHDDPLERLEAVAGEGELQALQAEARGIEVSEPVGRYLLRLVAATRNHPDIELGVSTRGALQFFRAAQASALLAGRRYANPDDVQRLAPAVLGHRISLAPQARYGGRTAAAIVAEIAGQTPVPT
jgi:MoxR-like ATPase